MSVTAVCRKTDGAIKYQVQRVVESYGVEGLINTMKTLFDVSFCNALAV